MKKIKEILQSIALMSFNKKYDYDTCCAIYEMICKYERIKGEKK